MADFNQYTSNQMYDNYYSETQPELGASDLWKTAFKGSLATTYLRQGVWKNLAAGKGIAWSGVFGLRSIASGTTGYTGAFIKANPVRKAIESTIGVFSKSRAEQFRVAGLFGREAAMTINGITGQTSGLFRGLPYAEKISDIIGGKSNFRITKFRTPEEIQKAIQKKTLEMQTKNFAPEIQTKYINKLETTSQKMLKIAPWLKRGAMGMRLLSAASWLSLGATAGSMVVGGVINTTNAMSDAIQQKMQMFTNRKMEFGGQLSAGFMSAGAVTERQRATQAMVQSGVRGRGVMGNEGAYQHVGNTW